MRSSAQDGLQVAIDVFDNYLSVPASQSYHISCCTQHLIRCKTTEQGIHGKAMGLNGQPTSQAGLHVPQFIFCVSKSILLPSDILASGFKQFNTASGHITSLNPQSQKPKL
jgi:hypothetical protein